VTGSTAWETTEVADVSGDGEIHHATVTTPATTMPRINPILRRPATLRDRLEDMRAILSPFGFKSAGRCLSN
ncbi:uncharacterized protein METZ01_LOCUS457390, partial [marine metagenome]